MHPGVYATFGTRARLPRPGCSPRASRPATGAVASHRSALWIWGLLDGEQPVEVTAPRRSHPVPDGFVLHRPNQLRPIDVTMRRHVPVTNPMRALLDAGARRCRDAVVGECVERALESRLVTVKGLRVILADLGGRGRSGHRPPCAATSTAGRSAIGDPES